MRDPVDTSADDASWWVPGRPATFATAGEKAWKLAVAANVPTCVAPHPHRGIELDFSLDGAQEGPHAADVDNLIEPLLSAFVNGQRWFGGRRPNVEWILARKSYTVATGCRITLSEQRAGFLGDADLIDEFAAVYPGPLPASGRDLSLSDWLSSSCGATELRPGPVACSLEFASTSINLGDIATGRVKTVIDGTWPLLGGTPGAPRDSRIRVLALSRAHSDVPAAGVRLRMGVLPAASRRKEPPCRTKADAGGGTRTPDTRIMIGIRRLRRFAPSREKPR